jgi:prephenate dehydrogenase
VISHLPYVLSSALAWLGRERGELARTLAGRGFDDLTRMSRFAFEVQGEVARRNPHLLEAAAAFEARLHALLSALAASPEEARALFDGARRPDAEAS